MNELDKCKTRSMNKTNRKLKDGRVGLNKTWMQTY